MSFNDSFGAKDTASNEVFAFDFTDMLEDLGLTIQSQSVTISVISGVDAASAAMLSGSPQLSGNVVKQRVINGVAGVSYHLRCLVTLSDGTSVLVIGADFDVRTF